MFQIGTVVISKHSLVLLIAEKFSPPGRKTTKQTNPRQVNHVTMVSSHQPSPSPCTHGLLASANVSREENYSTENMKTMSREHPDVE